MSEVETVQAAVDEARAEEMASTETNLETGMPWPLLTLMAALLTSVAFTVGLIAIYHFWLARPSAGFAVVDIASVVRVKEAEFTALLSRPEVSDKERMAAYQLVSRMGPEIERAVGELQKECACTIIVKSAVIAGVAEDLTPRLKEMLGMTARTEERS